MKRGTSEVAEDTECLSGPTKSLRSSRPRKEGTIQCGWQKECREEMTLHLSVSTLAHSFKVWPKARAGSLPSSASVLSCLGEDLWWGVGKLTSKAWVFRTLNSVSGIPRFLCFLLLSQFLHWAMPYSRIIITRAIGLTLASSCGWEAYSRENLVVDA